MIGRLTPGNSNAVICRMVVYSQAERQSPQLQCFRPTFACMAAIDAHCDVKTTCCLPEVIATPVLLTNLERTGRTPKIYLSTKPARLACLRCSSPAFIALRHLERRYHASDYYSRGCRRWPHASRTSHSDVREVSEVLLIPQSSLRNDVSLCRHSTVNALCA